MARPSPGKVRGGPCGDDACTNIDQIAVGVLLERAVLAIVVQERRGERLRNRDRQGRSTGAGSPPADGEAGEVAAARFAPDEQPGGRAQRVHRRHEAGLERRILEARAGEQLLVARDRSATATDWRRTRSGSATG